jgi:hypothetical protein
MTGNIHPKDIDIIFKTLLEADLVLGFGSNNPFPISDHL